MPNLAATDTWFTGGPRAWSAGPAVKKLAFGHRFNPRVPCHWSRQKTHDTTRGPGRALTSNTTHLSCLWRPGVLAHLAWVQVPPVATRVFYP